MSTEKRKRTNVQLSPENDEWLRRGVRYMGDLSRIINEKLDKLRLAEATQQ